jgi:hypothetical protein
MARLLLSSATDMRRGLKPTTARRYPSASARIDVSRIEHDNIVDVVAENRRQLDRFERDLRQLRHELDALKKLVRSPPSEFSPQ